MIEQMSERTGGSLDSVQLLADVAALLHNAGMEAYHDFPNVVQVNVGPRFYIFGDANKTWCGDVYDNAMRYDEGFAPDTTIDLHIAVDYPVDAPTLAQAIRTAVEEDNA